MTSKLGNLLALIKEYFERAATYHVEHSITITINPQKHSEIRIKLKGGEE